MGKLVTKWEDAQLAVKAEVSGTRFVVPVTVRGVSPDTKPRCIEVRTAWGTIYTAKAGKESKDDLLDANGMPFSQEGLMLAVRKLEEARYKARQRALKKARRRR